MVIFLKKYILAILIGLVIGGITVYGTSNYLYSSDEVSYTPGDNSWNVNSVDKALDDLYTKTTTMMPIPTQTKSITSNGNNIDVKNYAKVNVNVPSGGAIYLGEFSSNTTINVSNLGATSSGQFIAVASGIGTKVKNWQHGSVDNRWENGWTSYANPTLSLNDSTLTVNVGTLYVEMTGQAGSSGGASWNLPTKVYYVGNIITN